MTGAWLNFIIVVFLQLIFFIAHAYYEKKLAEIPRILVRSIPVGIVVGVLFDLMVGRFLGFHFYALGFGAFSLFLNGVFLYSFFVANILLMQRARLMHFCVGAIAIAMFYEIPHYFFRVWTWELPLPPYIEFLTVLLVGYVGGAILMAVCWHILGRRFLFIDDLLKK
ncbi:MAG: hypothetical protein WC849_01575 [Candidatus Paceibacterota bacterium]